MSLTLELLHILPKNLISRATGALSSVRFPPALNRRIISWFVNRYGVNVSEAEHPIEHYPSLGEFFVRNLKAGCRPIDGESVSPVDGAISEQGVIENGTLLQVKGRTYPLDELIGRKELAARFEGGYFLTIYLAPGDYHHIHSPVSGEISEFIAIPGTLWPVNPESVQRISKVFCRNERVISLIETRDFGMVAVVKVGATNVGSIALAYDSFVSNRSPVSRLPARIFFEAVKFLRAVKLFEVLNRLFGISAETSAKPFGVEPPFSRQYREKISVERGQRIATFRMGSTVVLLFEKGKFLPGENCRKERIKLGERLGSAEYL